MNEHAGIESPGELHHLGYDVGGWVGAPTETAKPLTILRQWILPVWREQFRRHRSAGRSSVRFEQSGNIRKLKHKLIDDMGRLIYCGQQFPLVFRLTKHQQKFDRT